MVDFLRVFAGRLLRTLSSLDGLANAAYQFFFFAYSRRAISHSFALGVQIGLAALLNYIASLHDPMLPAHWRDQPFYIFGLPLLAAVFTFVLVTIPLLLIRHHDQKRRAVSIHANQILEQEGLYSASLAGRSPATSPRARLLDAGLLHDLVEAARTRGAETRILTPTGFYLCADRLLPTIRDQLRPTHPALPAVALIADSAGDFRSALTEFPGTLHFIMADLDDLGVSAAYYARAARAELSQELAKKIVREARKVIKEIKRIRRSSRPSRATVLHATPYLPDRRLMVTETMCFAQMLPRGELGVLQPVVLVDRTQAPFEYATIRRSLQVLSSVL